MQPHRQDSVSREWLLDARLGSWLNALTGRDPYAVQTMFYFKPPGARGQALHQDQYYLRVQPGTCIAAWMAVDRCDRETGCLQVVPGTRDVPVLCTEQADHDASFSSVTVPLPPHLSPEDVIMEPGDVLLFNGQVIHGSLPNRSRTRFRRALIGHYIAGEAQQVAPLLLPGAGHGRPRGGAGEGRWRRPVRGLGGPRRPPDRRSSRLLTELPYPVASVLGRKQALRRFEWLSDNADAGS